MTIDGLNDIVSIEVGASVDEDQSKVFTVHSGLLTQRPISFKERLSRVPNIQVHALSLPSYNPNTSELYLHFVYKNQFPRIPGPSTYDILQKKATPIRKALRETAGRSWEELCAAGCQMHLYKGTKTALW